jgi:hypothetical protein
MSGDLYQRSLGIKVALIFGALMAWLKPRTFKTTT